MMYADYQTGMFFMVWDCTHASMGVGALAACGESLRGNGSMVFCESSSDRGASAGSVKCYDYPPNGTIAFHSELPVVTDDTGFSATGRPWFLDGAEYGAHWSPIRRSDFAPSGFGQTYSVAVDHYDEQGSRTLLGVVGAQRHEGDSCSNPTEVRENSIPHCPPLSLCCELSHLLCQPTQSSPIDWTGRYIPAVDVEPQDSTTEDDVQGSGLFALWLVIGLLGAACASYLLYEYKKKKKRTEENKNLTDDSDATKDATTASTDIVLAITSDAPKTAPKGSVEIALHAR